ncbi:hypothetical protein [Streptomyces sp. NPDC127119]|uniref:hypothetical protein n=1 Tax=Streptomyces sp. NPDC127119 TaxID=3345370 RepID=UPI003627FE6B
MKWAGAGPRLARAAAVAEHDHLTRGPQQLHALHVLCAEHDNVLAAPRHLCDSRNADGALRLALGLIWYWRMRGRDDDAAYWLDQATEIPTGHRGVQHDIATTFPLRALLRQYDGELDGAVQDVQAAKEAARALGALSIQDEIYIALRLTDLHTRTDQPARALELITTTRQRVLASHSPGMAIILDACQARLHLQTGDLANAGELLDTTETALSHRRPLRGAHDLTEPRIRTLSARARTEIGDQPFEEAYTAGWDLKVTAALQRADPALQLAARPPG